MVSRIRRARREELPEPMTKIISELEMWDLRRGRYRKIQGYRRRGSGGGDIGAGEVTRICFAEAKILETMT